MLNEVSGVGFDEIWQGRVVTEVDGVPLTLIGREALGKNKKACGRDKALVDLRILGEIPG